MPLISKSLPTLVSNVTRIGQSAQGPLPNVNPAAASQYNVSTIDGIVFGILITLLSLYTAFRHRHCYSGMTDARISTTIILAKQR